MEFILSSSEALLLSQFEQNPSLEMLSKALGRDSTAISRQLKRISEKGDFLIKSHGRWKITETGKKLNHATKDYLLSQSRIVKEEIHLRIGSTREFCTRILAPNISKLEKVLDVNSLSLISYEGSVEDALLSGQIDLGLDCGRPYSPDVRYKQVLKEPIAPVISNRLFKHYGEIQSFKELENFPHILCDRLYPDRVSKKAFLAKNIVSRCNDIAIARSLCLTSYGWALLPIYTIREELKSKKLKVVNDISFSYEKFGVWYQRERESVTPFFEKLTAWLSENDELMLANL